jgi:hypothetical protein
VRPLTAINGRSRLIATRLRGVQGSRLSVISTLLCDKLLFAHGFVVGYMISIGLSGQSVAGCEALSYGLLPFIHSAILRGWTLYRPRGEA